MSHHNTIQTLIENKENIAGAATTTGSTVISNMAADGSFIDIASGWFAVIVGLLTTIKLIRDLFFKKGKS